MEAARPQPSRDASGRMKRAAQIILTLLAAGMMYAGNLVGIAAMVCAAIGVAWLASQMSEIFWGLIG